MNDQWKSFISNNSSQFLSNAHLDNGCLFDLTDSDVLLEFTGEDCKTFLQGQLTNDINDITNEISQLSGYCNPKGRLLALFRIFSINDKIYLQFPASLLAKIQKRLQMFVMMSKVTIKDVSNELINIGLAGSKISELLRQQFSGLETKDNQVITQNGLSIITITGEKPGTTPQYQCIGTIDKIQSFCSQLFSNSISLINNDGWNQLNIQAGLPTVEAGTLEAFVPQMLNLHRLNGINFKKGCYTGQEVVARMHYLGKSKRAMYQLSFTSKTLPQPGDSSYSPQSDSGQGAGKIVSICSLAGSQQNENRILILAVLEITIAEQNAVFLDENCTIKGEIIELPYSLDED